MATVPVIQDSVQLQTQTGRRGFRADADAYGGAEARGLANVGQGLASVAEAADEIDQVYSQARAHEAYNQYDAQVREEVTTYTNSQLGRNAIDNRAAIEARIAEIGDEIGSGLSGRAANAYREAANRRAASALGDVAEHSSRQARAFQIEQIDVAIDNATNAGVAAFADPDARDRARERGMAEVNRLGALQGWDETITANRRRAFASDFNARIITQLAVTDPEAAEALYTSERPNMDAQQAGELLTTIRVAQSQAKERISGEVWQAIARGQSPRSLPVWREFSTNPLYGTEHIQVNDYLRSRAEHEASGATIPANGPAYIAAILAADRDPQSWSAPGVLEQYLADNAGAMRGSDMEALLTRRRTIRSGDDATAGQQSAAFNATLALSRAILGAHGFDPDPPASVTGDPRNRALAFQAALQREVQNYTTQHGVVPAGDDIQGVIARALTNMNASEFQNMPAFRADTRARVGNARVRAGVQANVPVLPFDAIPADTRRQLIDGLRRRLGRTPSLGEVENAYANISRGVRWDGAAPEAGQ